MEMNSETPQLKSTICRLCFVFFFPPRFSLSNSLFIFTQPSYFFCLSTCVRTPTCREVEEKLFLALFSSSATLFRSLPCPSFFIPQSPFSIRVLTKGRAKNSNHNSLVSFAFFYSLSSCKLEIVYVSTWLICYILSGSKTIDIQEKMMLRSLTYLYRRLYSVGKK